MGQGDDCDSSDEEWDEHIGRHARAFLGLNEPVAEIALDEGVEIGTMVRDAFVRADNIHMQASAAVDSHNGGSDSLQADGAASEVEQRDRLPQYDSGDNGSHEQPRNVGDSGNATPSAHDDLFAAGDKTANEATRQVTPPLGRSGMHPGTCAVTERTLRTYWVKYQMIKWDQIPRSILQQHCPCMRAVHC